MSDIKEIDIQFVEEEVKVLNLRGGVNTPKETILKQVRHNNARGLKQFRPFGANKDKVILVCSGTTLGYHLPDLIREHFEGAKLVAVNGAYDFLLNNNLKPSMAVMLDARPQNARFFKRDVPGCKYFIASQCHPSVFETLQGRDITIWQAMCNGEEEEKEVKEYFFDNVQFIPCGTTVGIRAINMLNLLGFQRISIYGMDCCWMGEEHHAFPQEENENEKFTYVWVKPEGRPDAAKRFKCTPWHMRQWLDFQQLLRFQGDKMQLAVHGDGLIATMLKTMHELHMEK